MLKKEYYCLVAGLPDLFFNENRSEFDSLIFKNELKLQLRKSDFELAKLLYLKYDNENLLNLLLVKNVPFNSLGNYSKDFLEAQMANPIKIPDYMIDFIRWYNKQEIHELNIITENKLHSLFYEYLVSTKNQFLSEWFSFELNIKNILTVFNCEHFKYETEKHLICVGQNNLVYSLLINDRLKPEYFEEELPFADHIFRVAESKISPEEKEKKIDKILWDYLDEYTFFNYFTIEKILSYIIKLGIIERWMKLDIETGKALLNKLIEDIKLSYTFPEEFSILK
ncbi:MAG: DUF2764 family protein [Draconibacterium sp.]|nr:DUF2764 family protein [Draconibacterium sp.]